MRSMMPMHAKMTDLLLCRQQGILESERIPIMYRYSAQMRTNVTNMRLRRNIVFALLAVLLVLTIVFGISAASNAAFKREAGDRFSQCMASSISSAIEVVNRLESTTGSTTSQRLGMVRQYVYTMDQVNQISVALFGESGRYAPDDAFTALYSDLETYEGIVQSAKNSTLDARTLLTNHLTILQEYISGNLVS